MLEIGNTRLGISGKKAVSEKSNPRPVGARNEREGENRGVKKGISKSLGALARGHRHDLENE